MNKEVIIIEDLNKYLFKSNINYKVALKVFSHCPPDRAKLLIIL